MTYSFLIVSTLLLVSAFFVNPILGEESFIFNNLSHHFSLMYPSSWNLQFNDDDNISSTFQKTITPGVDPIILEINSISQQNVSLFKYVLFAINKNIDKYAVDLYSSFSIQNLTHSEQASNNPVYCVEYFVIMSNNEKQTPNSISDCYIRNNINNDILELHFVQTGYGIDPKNKLNFNKVLESITFK